MNNLPKLANPSTVRLPEKLRTFLRKEARRQHRPLSHLMVWVLLNWARTRGFEPKEPPDDQASSL